MNDKIKEILNGKVGFVFNHKDRDEILDLITDLQQINKNLTNSLNKKVEEGIKLQQENERLNKRVKECEEGFKATTEDLCEESTKIERLNNIINETRRILGEYKHFSTPTEEQNSENEEIVDKAYIKLHSNLQELKGSNEPSFEEMVGFVEKVYKDIKSQSTLHEELEEERKTIAKIVGDFKEVNK